MPDGCKHHVTNIVAGVAACRRNPAHRLPVATIQRKGDAQWLAILTPELEAIEAPSLIVELPL
jgi:hypothetical protein